jgi:hypothetical protein
LNFSPGWIAGQQYIDERFLAFTIELRLTQSPLQWCRLPPAMTMIRPLLLIVLAGALPGGLRAELKQTISISATARPDYVRPTDPAGAVKPETYVFAQGHFLGGTRRDGRLERTTFTDIIQTLVPSLVKQNYFPTRDQKAADLYIVVHWGTTSVYQDPLWQFNIADLNTAAAEYNGKIASGGIADYGWLNTLQSQADMGADSTIAAINYNAMLLGYAPTLEKERRHPWSSALEIVLNEELNEERYFVFLMAYDLPFMLKEHQPKLLWVTRLSMRSHGNNFTEALPALSNVGGQFFGRHLGGLAQMDASWRDGHVKLGDLKIIGEVESAAPAKRE